MLQTIPQTRVENNIWFYQPSQLCFKFLVTINQGKFFYNDPF